MTQQYLDIDGVVKHPGLINPDHAQNDYMNNGHYDSRDPQFRYNGPNVSALKKPIPTEVLNALGEEARRLGRGLTDDERDSIYARFEN
ncbi:MAG TPA: hypothetical protein VNX26_02320 [Candidatus Acidoferrum sp.]|jgi:hypothetical protein|nr:hypothetical protein [Candidatus Acidoferrum sp.]